jgi:hypothetical protein
MAEKPDKPREIGPPMTPPERPRQTPLRIQYTRGMVHPNDASNRLPPELRPLDAGEQLRRRLGRRES